MWFGLLIEGSALEVAARDAPKKVSMYDGYATVDFGRWHFHLCIGEHTASGLPPILTGPPRFDDNRWPYR